MKERFDQYRDGDRPSASEENEKAEELFRVAGKVTEGAQGPEGKTAFRSSNTNFWAMITGITYQGGGLPAYYTYIQLWEDGSEGTNNPPTLVFNQDPNLFVGPIIQAGVTSSFAAFEVNGSVTVPMPSISSIITPALAITNASGTTPIKITFGANHGLVGGQIIVIWGVLGNDAANGQWKVTIVDALNINLFFLDGVTASTSSGTYTSGGNWCTFDGVIVRMWPGEGADYLNFEEPGSAENATCNIVEGHQGGNTGQSITASTWTLVKVDFEDIQEGTDLQFYSGAGVTFLKEGVYHFNAHMGLANQVPSGGAPAASDCVILEVHTAVTPSASPSTASIARDSKNWQFAGGSDYFMTLACSGLISVGTSGVNDCNVGDTIFMRVFSTLAFTTSSQSVLPADAAIPKIGVFKLCAFFAFTTTSTTTTTTSTTTTTGTTTTTTTTTSTTTTTAVCGATTAQKATNTTGSSAASSVTASMTLSTGDLLLFAVVACDTSSAYGNGTCTWNSISMTRDSTTAVAAGSNRMILELFHLKIASGATANLVYTPPASVQMCYRAQSVTGLTNGALDQSNKATGTTSSTPNSGNISSTACEFLWGVIAQFRQTLNITQGTWQSGFSDINFASFAVGGGADHMLIDDGDRIPNTPLAAISANKSGTAQTAFIISIESFN